MDAEPEIGEVEVPVRLQGLAASPVVIGDGVLVGPGAVVLAGARVARWGGAGGADGDGPAAVAELGRAVSSCSSN